MLPAWTRLVAATAEPPSAMNTAPVAMRIEGVGHKRRICFPGLLAARFIMGTAPLAKALAGRGDFGWR
jgi:hypothetical protein